MCVACSDVVLRVVMRYIRRTLVQTLSVLYLNVILVIVSKRHRAAI